MRPGIPLASLLELYASIADIGRIDDDGFRVATAIAEQHARDVVGIVVARHRLSLLRSSEGLLAALVDWADRDLDLAACWTPAVWRLRAALELDGDRVALAAAVLGLASVEGVPAGEPLAWEVTFARDRQLRIGRWLLPSSRCLKVRRNEEGVHVRGDSFQLVFPAGSLGTATAHWSGRPPLELPTANGRTPILAGLGMTALRDRVAEQMQAAAAVLDRLPGYRRAVDAVVRELSVHTGTTAAPSQDAPGRPAVSSRPSTLGAVEELVAGVSRQYLGILSLVGSLGLDGAHPLLAYAGAVNVVRCLRDLAREGGTTGRAAAAWAGPASDKCEQLERTLDPRRLTPLGRAVVHALR